MNLCGAGAIFGDQIFVYITVFKRFVYIFAAIPESSPLPSENYF